MSDETEPRRIKPRRATIGDLLTRVVATPPPGGKLTLDDLMARAGRRGPAFMMLFLCILSMIFSIVPGVSTVIGLPLLLLCWNMVMGRRRLALPRWLGNKSLDHTLLAQGMIKRLELVHRIEKVLRPRLRVLCTKTFLRLSGLVGIFCSIVLSLPIPLMNFPPTLAVFLIALGVLGRDGLMILAGYVVAIAVAVTLTAITIFGVDVVGQLFTWLGF